MISSIKKMFSVCIAGAMLITLGGLSACSNETVEEPDQTMEVEEELRVIGSPSDDAIEIIVENGTGKDIVGVAVKASNVAEYGSSLISTKEMIEDGERVLVYIPAAEGTNEVEAAEDAAEASSGEAQETDDASADVVLRILYSVSLTFDDETTAELHDIGIADIKELTILLSDEGIAYIEYENSSGKIESTLETEKALKAAAEAEAQAKAQTEADAAAAQAEATAQADAAAAQSAATSQPETAPSESSQYTYDTGSSSNAGTQTEDTCVDPNDLVFN